MGVPSFSRCELTKQFCSKLGRAVRYNPLFAASYLLAMTWDFHFHRSRKPKTLFIVIAFFLLKLLLPLILPLQLILTFTLPFLPPFYFHPFTLSFTEGWGEDKKKPRFVRNRVFKERRRHTLPQIAVPSAQAGLTSLFGMGRGEPRRNNHLKVVVT